MIGETLALLAALSFSGMSIFARKAQQKADPLLLTLVSIIINALIFGTIYGVQVLRGSAAPFIPEAAWLFFLGGFFGSALGRSATYIGILHIGPSRNTAIRGAIPLFALILAFFFIGEKPSWGDTAGILLVVSGLACLALENNRHAVPSGGAAAPGSGSPGRTPAASRLWTLGIIISFAGALSQGIGSTIVKGGLNITGSPLQSAFVGSWAGLAFYLALFTYLRRWRGFVSGLKSSWPFGVWAGISNSVALMLGYTAFTYSHIAVTEALIGTQPILTIALSALFLGKLESISRPLILSALLVVGGATSLVFLG